MAVSNSLGTLTLDVVANVGAFTGPLDQAARITKKQMKEMGMTVDEFGNYTDKAMKQAAQATKQLDTQFEKLAESLQRETALYGETSRAAQMRYDLEKGALQNLSAAQKDSLTEMTRRLSAMESANAAFREQANAIKQLDAAHAQLFASMGREIELYGQTTRVAQLRYDMEKGALRDLTEQQKRSIVGRASILDAMDAEAAKTREAAAATKQLDATHDQLNESMLAQLATYGQVTRVAKLRYDMERGALRGLTEAQKQSSIQLAQQLDNLDKAAQGSMRGIRGVATGIGYQMQDIAVQLQMGTNPLMVFAQQGSQIASLFGPTGAVAGAVIAIGGALAGALIPSLFKTGDATEEVADKVSALVSEMDKLNAAQRQVVETANLYRIADKQKEYENQKKAIEDVKKEIQALNEENGKTRVVTQAGTGITATTVRTEVIDNTLKLAEATRDLNTAETNRVAIERELAELNDPAKAKDLLASKLKELELIGLKGDELHRQMAIQAQLTGLDAYAYEQIMRNIDAANARVKAEEDAAKAAEDAAKKAREDEKSRADSIAKTIAGMEREIALYGVTSKAAQTEYDILNNVLKVKGGLEGVEGRRLIQLAKTQDAMDAEKESQDEYVAKMKEWVKGENDKVAAVDKIIKGLEKEQAELGLTADAYLEVQLRAKGATDEQVKYAVGLAQSNREATANAKNLEEMFKRLDEIGASIWTDMLNGTSSVFDSLKEMFASLLADMAHQALTKPIMLNIQQAASGGGTSAGQGLLSGVGMGGVYAAGAVALIAAVNSWNKAQDEKFEKMTAAYRQGVQSTGTLLGMANAKSDSIAQALSEMGDLSGDVLNVNRDMYMALLAIESGINGVAAGFARQFGISGGAGDWSNIQTGSSAGMKSLSQTGFMKDIESGAVKLDVIGGEFISGFVGGIIGGINKAVYSKSERIIDSGISFIGQSLADILERGAVGAFAYADVQTKKRVLGVTTSVRVRTETEDLNDILLGQFAGVFEGAGEALGLAAEAFGLEFDDYINKLVVDPQKLSLKGLGGDALTKEIEAFFSSTLDNWAGVLTKGSDVLLMFQQVGEGAFETVIRLANQLNTFKSYADALNLNFAAVGFEAVVASQNIATFAGGFDQLGNSLGGYYQNFFTEEERAAKQMDLLAAELAELGVNAVPTSREAFRDMIESLADETGLMTVESQKQFAALLNLQGVFAELVGWTEEAAEGIEGVVQALKDAASSAFDVLARSIEAERDRINTIVGDASSAKAVLDDAISREREALTSAHAEKLAQLKELAKAEQELAKAAADEDYKARKAAADEDYKARKAAAKAAEDSIKSQIKATEGAISGLSKLFEALTDSAQEMAIVTDEVARSRRRLAEFEIDTAIRNARAGNGIATDGRIDEAVATLKDNPASLYSSFEDMAYATAVTQNKLLELAGLTTDQISYEQSTLSTLQAQLSALENVEVVAQEVAKATYEMSTKYDAQIALEDAALAEQLAALDAMSAEAQKQFDKLTGIDTTLLTLDQAMAAYNVALLAADFENAQEQLAALDEMESTARAQLDTLLGIETGILAVRDALNNFGEAVRIANDRIANDRISAAGIEQAQASTLKTNTELLEQMTALRQESLELNNVTRQNTQDTADILRQMQEEALTP